MFNNQVMMNRRSRAINRRHKNIFEESLIAFDRQQKFNDQERSSMISDGASMIIVNASLAGDSGSMFIGRGSITIDK